MSPLPERPDLDVMGNDYAYGKVGQDFDDLREWIEALEDRLRWRKVSEEPIPSRPIKDLPPMEFYYVISDLTPEPYGDVFVRTWSQEQALEADQNHVPRWDVRITHWRLLYLPESP